MPLSAHTLPPRAQRGQALPLGLAFILAASLLTLVVFNTGEMAPEKSQVANTADAAVYSGLVWQARSLNFQAYTNRAMVANQVSIAQLVSLGSWTNYGRISARNLDATAGNIPFLKPFTAALLQAMTTIETVVQNAVKVAIPIIDGVTTVLSVVQEAVYNASYVATPEVVSTIVKANDQRYRAFSTYSIASNLRNAKAWQSLTSRHSGEDERMARKAGVINASLDEFSADRGWDSVPGLPSKVYVTPIDRFEIIKEGTTRLMQDGADWEWRGKDGLSLHWEHFSCGFSGCGWDHQEIPMGWGSNYAEGDGACSGGQCSGWFADNGRAEQWADAEAEDLGSGFNGVKAYRSLKDLSRENRDPRLQLHVEVDVANADVRTAQKIRHLGSPAPAADGMDHGIEPGMFYTDDTFAGDSIASISAGEVFFERPVLSEGDKLQVEGRAVEEYANLFNPYWDVRLINVSEKQRQIAWAIRSPGLAVEATTSVVVDAATDAVTDAATDALSEYTDIDQGDIDQYTAIGEQAINILQDGALTDAIKDAALSALTSAAQGALSDYAETNGFGDLADTAIAVAEDGEINRDDLDIVAGDYLDGTALGDALATATGVEDIVNHITADFEGAAAALGDELKDSIADTFATELGIDDQLTNLGNTVDSIKDSVDAGVDNISTALQEQGREALNAGLDDLEQSLGGSLADFGLDRDTIINDFTAGLEGGAQGLVDESRAALNNRFDEVQASINNEISTLEINPETVANGVLDGAQQFISEQAGSLQTDVNQAFGDLTEQGADVLTDQLQTTLDQATQQAQQASASQSAKSEELPVLEE